MGTSGLQSYCSLRPDFLIYFVVVLILVYSFQICVYYFCVFANKSYIQETCYSNKYLLSRVDNL